MTIHWRAVLYQLLGAALLTPVAAVLALLVVTEVSLPRMLLLWTFCLPASALVACLPLVGRLEVVALRELLGVAVPEHPDRVYLRVLTALHLFVGATLSAGALALSPGVPVLLSPARWRAEPGQLAQVLLLIVVVAAAMAGAGLGQQRAARRLLRADPSRVIEELGRRQSLALELHDSVGHALSVILVQAMAAQAALRRAETVPVAAQSLDHLLGAARDAQQELDVLLRVLDEGSEAQAPTLGSLDALVRGLAVECRADPVDDVPEQTSRAAYAIAREAVTNALRHGRGPVRLDLAVGTDVVLTVDNDVAGRPPSGEGRGLVGMRMRARLAGGTFEQEEVDGRWRITAKLPR
ncbi:sensor histidine kinase [Nonomuraea mesophila]|uniref:sensor histidine kinase n=1 Tax=Nonomuraea mesophila TaxID=2530382 RepID=UPI00140B4532|nr:histidine kinase [Nonomuraea mesophila]